MGVKYRINRFLFILLFLSLPLFSQTEFSGKITAASGEALPGASVLLKDKEQKITAFAITGDSGGYLLETIKLGELHTSDALLNYNIYN